ncbi:Dabb family protein [Allomuricauda sp. d1]|uniref:Dabb family protein n=1 Tax=Allomuricauda sp. d1 TaxID=3136725 RepID=UPI0031D1ED13
MKNLTIYKAIFTLMFAFGIQAQQSKAETKPLQHVLLFDWKENVEESQKSEIMTLFYGLVDKIDGMESLKAMDVVKSSGNYDVAIFMVFDNEEALKEYEKHPDHIRISETAPPLLASFGVFDFYGDL